MEKGSDVMEYGQIIGEATENIARGQYVHVHNIRTRKWWYRMKEYKIEAYRRENGQYGIRNYVLLLPLDAVSCQICRGVNLFTTGKGNNVGNPICPVVKITANKETCKNSGENIDVDISDIWKSLFAGCSGSDRRVYGLCSRRGVYSSRDSFSWRICTDQVVPSIIKYCFVGVIGWLDFFDLLE